MQEKLKSQEILRFILDRLTKLKGMRMKLPKKPKWNPYNNGETSTNLKILFTRISHSEQENKSLQGQNIVLKFEKTN